MATCQLRIHENLIFFYHVLDLEMQQGEAISESVTPERIKQTNNEY